MFNEVILGASVVENKANDNENTENFLNRKKRNEIKYLEKLKEKKKKNKKNKKKADHIQIANKNNIGNIKDNINNKMNYYRNVEDTSNKQNHPLTIDLQEDNPQSEEMQAEMQRVLKAFDNLVSQKYKIKKNLSSNKSLQSSQSKSHSNISSSISDAPTVKVFQGKLSNKQRKKNYISLTQLKLNCKYPSIITESDCAAKDPFLLVALKSQRNTIPVPLHWTRPNQYLQSQRGQVRVKYNLPSFIEATGISKLRELADNSKVCLKQRLRQRMQPKLGRNNIDYQVLYDAFFKNQTKPELLKIGEVYYDGKEMDNKTKRYMPGRLSSKLKNALGITNNMIPPFVDNMLKYGAPKSYSFLKIPGVNIRNEIDTDIVCKNLWKEPERKKFNESIWKFDLDKTHWYHYDEEELEEENDLGNDKADDKENKEGKEDNKNGSIDEKDIDEMGNDQDDLEISDDENLDVKGVFNNKEKEDKLKKKLMIDNKEFNEDNAEEESAYSVNVKEVPEDEKDSDYNNDKRGEDFGYGDENEKINDNIKEENEEDLNLKGKIEETFYKILNKETLKANNEDKKINKNSNDENIKEDNENMQEEENSEENIEEINRNIF